MSSQHDALDANHPNRCGGNGHADGGSARRSRVDDLTRRIAADPDLFYTGGGAGSNGRNGHAVERREASAGQLEEPKEQRADTPEHPGVSSSVVELVASVDFPTRHGRFLMYGFLETATGLEHTAVVKGDVRNTEGCPVRVHSECHTGDVWGSLRCDCRDQLEFALRYLGSVEHGAIVYLRQEGRGIGLLNKLKAYRLQDLGLDTVEANHVLGYPAEARSYRVAARILETLGVISIELMSNNPDKIEKLRADGVQVVGRIPVVSVPTAHNRLYLDTKRTKMGHLY